MAYLDSEGLKKYTRDFIDYITNNITFPNIVRSFNGRKGDVESAPGDYTPEMVGAVPISRKVNGKQLNQDITLTADDIGITPVDTSNLVPNTRKVNGKALSSDITLSAEDIGVTIPDLSAYAPKDAPIFTNSISMGRASDSIVGVLSSAFGNNCTASNDASHAEGYHTTASGVYSHAEGSYTTASHGDAHAEGESTTASNAQAHAEGSHTNAVGVASHAEGSNTNASSNFSHAEGNSAIASAEAAHAEGVSTRAIGDGSHTEGYTTIASGLYSHAEGNSTRVTGDSAHAEGMRTNANGQASHAEGNNTTTSIAAKASHAEGDSTSATNTASHAEGYKANATGKYAHAEGNNTTASGLSAHAEGCGSNATAQGAHSEGISTKANSSASHAEGYFTNASSNGCHSEGWQTNASNFASHVCGKFSSEMTDGGAADNTTGDVFVVGNGTTALSRSNAFRVTYAGNVYAQSSTLSTGADYAEYFEWLDGNPQNEDRVGRFVTLEGNKIKYAQEGDYVLGVISGLPCVIGNADEDWLGRWEHDDFNRFIKEYLVQNEVEVTPPIDANEEGFMHWIVTNDITEREGRYFKMETEVVDYPTSSWRYKPNQSYDATQPYVERKDRQEWDAVGMVGVLSVIDDGTCVVNGYAKVSRDGVATKATRSEESWRVISRVGDNIVKIIFILK